MTFAEAAMIMMSGGSANIQPLTVTQNGQYNAPEGVSGFNPVLVNVPQSSGGIWDMFNGREPLAVIALGPNTAVHILDMGNPLSSYANYNNNGTLFNEGAYIRPVAVLKYNNKAIAYYTGSYFGYPALKEYTLIGGTMLMTFQRTAKIGATNVSQCSYSKSGKHISLNLTIKFYIDYLNFSQHDYDDGSHWEESYAWYSGGKAYSPSFYFRFDAYESYTLNYDTNVLGDTIGAQNAIWVPVSKDVIENSENGFPKISYTKPEDHFDNDFYTNDAAINHGYYDSNVAYMEKWGKPELWA